MASSNGGNSGGSGRRTGGGAKVNLLDQVRALESAQKTTEALAAEEAIRNGLVSLADAVYLASQAKYNGLRKSGRFPSLNLNQRWIARQQRKMLDHAGASLDEAARAFSNVILSDQEILSASRRKDKVRGYDAAG